ncbi:MAG: phosphoenolpyruvate carboxykinase (GTP) [Gammaproteobacteria bacterium]|nr:phosphoenolpyruvate carboxykinase (GTP) [Gammaproteobacteria bacterium]
MTTNRALSEWVDEVARLTRPENVHWCDGGEEEFQRLIDGMLADGTLYELNRESYPRCYLHRSDPSDVARVEHLTFICSENEADAGPNNHWMTPNEAHKKVDALFEGAMKGRTLYVIPYCMGPIQSSHARLGVEITDSPYVVANMKIMTRMGRQALDRIEAGEPFVRGLHSTGDLSPDHRLILHFPEERLIKSVGSGYGGNALLGKKCHALRIASWQARDEGWLAEHMLIVGIQNPEGKTRYIAAAFPSACGKTNLAMLIPPKAYPGWKIWTVGDDIAWLHVGDDGRLWAINPEAGYFGVVPGTNEKTNKNAYDTITKNTIFTNVAVTEDMEPWWEGKKTGKPVTDWQGRPYDPATASEPAAHPNSRFTVSAQQNPSYSEEAEAPEGVPISAIFFGGRRASLAPLIFEAKSWEHGVLIGAGMASEKTAAAAGKVGEVRRDPMAMKPFCGYNYGDYWRYWLSFARRAEHPPHIFHVNWFRKGADGKFLWPGFGENLRVLEWALERCEGHGDADETPIGFVPARGAIHLEGLDIDNQTMGKLLAVDDEAWYSEYEEIAEYFADYGERLPEKLEHERERVAGALNVAGDKASQA